VKNIIAKSRIHRRFFLRAILGLPLFSCWALKDTSKSDLLPKNKPKSNSFEAIIEIDFKNIIKAVNRKVLGAGLVLPPFKTHEKLISTIFGDQTSVRLWPGQLTDEDFDEKKSLIVSLTPSQILAFSERSTHSNEKINYESASKNNLEPHQKAEKIIQDIQWILSRLSQVKYPPKGQFLYWEAWNEPQFDQNGAWDADLFAKYVNDLAAKIKQLKLPVKVGAALHMDNPEWNNQLCKRLNPNLVDFLVTHYYGFWENIKEPSNNFLARAGFGFVLRDRVRRDLELIKNYGQNKWTLHCSEWNLHPPKYEPPYNTTTDIAAAHFALSAIKIYLEESLESAQYFLISSQEHFGAISIAVDGTVKVHATGAAFRLMNECLHGKLLKVNIASPTYTLKVKQPDKKGKDYLASYSIPLIEAIACLWNDGTIKIVIGNKHETKSTNLKIRGIPLQKKLTIQTILEEKNKSEISELKKILTLNASSNNLTLPPNSIIAITINKA
jgi:alpha-L-arabinofuranosidase